MITYEGFAQNGWQCPVCGRVMAPSMMWCPWCADRQVHTVTNVNWNPDGSVTGIVRDIMVNPGKAKGGNDAAQ